MCMWLRSPYRWGFLRGGARPGVEHAFKVEFAFYWSRSSSGGGVVAASSGAQLQRQGDKGVTSHLRDGRALSAHRQSISMTNLAVTPPTFMLQKDCQPCLRHRQQASHIQVSLHGLIHHEKLLTRRPSSGPYGHRLSGTTVAGSTRTFASGPGTRVGSDAPQRGRGPDMTIGGRDNSPGAHREIRGPETVSRGSRGSRRRRRRDDKCEIL